MTAHTYVSVDIEADGPIPGPNSMLSLGSVAFSDEGQELAAFSANLLELLAAKPDEKTMAWWAKQGEAWSHVRENTKPASHVMEDYCKWLDSLPGQPVFVGYPASYDFMFVYWYLMKFVGRSPFGFQALDLESYAAAVLDKPFKQVVKSSMPKRWFKDSGTHTHVAVEDAREQGRLFFAMRAEREAMHEL